MSLCDDIINMLIAQVATIEVELAAIQTELGVDPEGIYATVRTRLDILEARVNNPNVPSPTVENPFIIGNTGVSIQAGFGAPPNGTTFPAVPGSLYLRQDGYSFSIVYGMDVNNTWEVIGASPVGAAGGDLSGSYPDPSVIAIQGNAIQAGTLRISQDGYVLTWVNASSNYQSLPVTKISGITVSGIPTTGQILEATSSTTANWQSPGSSITLNGDVTGSINNTIISAIDGHTLPSPVSGVLQEVSGVLGWGAINLASATYVTGKLAIANLAAGTSAQLLLSNATPASTWTTMSGDATLSAAGALTLATVASAGTSGGGNAVPVITINAKGLVTSITTTAVTPTSANLPTITLTGDATGSGSGGSIATTLSTVNANVGTFGSTTLVPVVTVNGKGLITAVSTATLPTSYPPSGSAGGDLTGSYPNPTIGKLDGYDLPSPVPGVLEEVGGSLVWSTINLASSSYVSGILPTANQAAQSVTLTGDTTSSGGTTAGAVTTLATVNSNVGTFGSSTSIPIVTVNGKGLVTAVSTASVVSGINQLTGDGTAGPGTGSQALTLATVNSNVGTFGSTTIVPVVTVNAKGLVTAVSIATLPTSYPPNGSAGGDLSGTYPNPNVAALQGNAIQSGTNGATQDGYVLTWVNGSSQYQVKPSATTGITQLTGDATAGPGIGSQALTLATVNAGAGTYGSSTFVPVFHVNAKGLVTTVTNTQISGLAVGTALTPGTSAQMLMSNATPTATWTTLSGDATISPTGALTFATVNSNVGTFGSTTQIGVFTVNGKGLITAASNVSLASSGLPTIALTGAVTGSASGGSIATTLASASLPTITLTGDATGAASGGSIATTLATVNSNTGTFGSTTQIGTFTVNGKGLITAASNVSLAASGLPTITLTGAVTGAASGGSIATTLASASLPTITLTGDVTGAASGGSVATTVTKITGSSPIAITPSTLQWLNSTTTPTLTQATPASDVATNTLSLIAQSAFASASTNQTGGALTLQSGVGIGTHAYGGGGATSLINFNIAGANTIIQLGNNVNSTAGDSMYFPNVFSFRGNNTVSLFSTNTLTLRAFGGSQPVAITSDTGAVQIQHNSVNMVQYDGYGVFYTSTSQSVATTGTVALTAVQQGATYIALTGSMTGNVTVQFTATVASNTVRSWIIDVSAVTFNAHTLTFGIGTNSTTASITTLTTNSNILTLYAPSSNVCLLNL